MHRYLICPTCVRLQTKRAATRMIPKSDLPRVALVLSTHVELEKRCLCLRAYEEGDVFAHHRYREYRSVSAINTRENTSQ